MGDSPPDYTAMKTVTLTKKVLGKSQQLIVDGEVWEDSSGGAADEYLPFRDSAHSQAAHSQRMSAYFRGTSLSKIAKLTLRQLSVHFGRITLYLPDSDANLFGLCGWEFNSIDVGIDRVDDQGRIPLICEIYYEFENWRNPYTIADLAQSIQDVLGEHPELPLTYWNRYGTRGSIAEGFGVQGAARHEDTIEHVLLLQKDLLDLSKLAEKHLEWSEFEDYSSDLAPYVGEAPPPHNISVLFSFPAPVKSACEQYLLYFGQFLSDLGIQVETDLAEKKAARVLFSVTPIDATQALTQIRDALGTYLRLPVLPEFAATASQFHDPAVAQLQANVLHLQSQMVLAKSVLQLKDATIQAKDAVIESLKGTIDLTGFVARPRKSHEESSSEPLIKGVVSVKKYDLKFLEFDFPAILKKLKRRWHGR